MSIAKSATLHHTCFVVNDVEKVAQSMADTLGIKPWSIWTMTPDDAMVNGKAAAFSFHIAIAQLGNSAYELIAPDTGDSLYVEHLKTKGEGFHHTCLMYENHQAMLSAKAEMISQGRKMVQSGRIADLGEFCYFEVAETGEIMELLFLSELPPPDKTIG